MDEGAEFIPEHIQVGRNGHLFLTTGNNVLQQYTKDQLRLEAQCQWRHLISSRKRRLRARGIAYRHIFGLKNLRYTKIYTTNPSSISDNHRHISYFVVIRTIEDTLSDQSTWSDFCAGAGAGVARWSISSIPCGGLGTPRCYFVGPTRIGLSQGVNWHISQFADPSASIRIATLHNARSSISRSTQVTSDPSAYRHGRNT